MCDQSKSSGGDCNHFVRFQCANLRIASRKQNNKETCKYYQTDNKRYQMDYILVSNVV